MCFFVLFLRAAAKWSGRGVMARLVFVLQVHLDHRHMGLGGDDSWSPCVHEQYLLPPTRYAFSLRLCPVLPTSSCHDIHRSQLPS